MPVGVGAAVGETPSLTGEFVGETHRGLEHAQTHPLGNQHQKGPLCLWVAGEVTEIWQRVEQVPLFALGPLPSHTVSQRSIVGYLTRVNTSDSAPYYVTGIPRQKKNGPNERTDQSSRKNTTKQ